MQWRPPAWEGNDLPPPPWHTLRLQLCNSGSFLCRMDHFCNWVLCLQAQIKMFSSPWLITSRCHVWADHEDVVFMEVSNDDGSGSSSSKQTAEEWSCWTWTQGTFSYSMLKSWTALQVNRSGWLEADPSTVQGWPSKYKVLDHGCSLVARWMDLRFGKEQAYENGDQIRGFRQASLRAFKMQKSQVQLAVRVQTQPLEAAQHELTLPFYA